MSIFGTYAAVSFLQAHLTWLKLPSGTWDPRPDRWASGPPQSIARQLPSGWRQAVPDSVRVCPSITAVALYGRQSWLGDE